MNASVRIQVRVQMGQAIAAFNSLIGRVGMIKKALDSAKKTSVGWAAATTNGFRAVELAGKRLTQTARILIYNFTLPIAAALALLEGKFLDVAEKQAILGQVYTTADGQSKRFGQTTGQVVNELKLLDKILLELSNGYGVSIQDTYDLAIAFARAGVAGVQLAYDTESALMLIRGFGVNADQASKAILQVSTSYRLTGKQTQVALGILAYASQQTRADLDTLTRAFVKAAPAASNLGIDVAHLTAILATMQQAGFKGEEAGTALNFALTRLLKPTPEAADLLKTFGVNVTDASYAAADGTKRLDILTNAFRGLSDIQRQYAINVLIGARQTTKLTAFFADALSPMSKYHQLLDATNDSTKDMAYLQEQVLLAMDNDKTRVQILTNELKNNFMVIAANLTPALIVLLRMLADASRWFKNLGDTAGGRTKQQLIILGLVALALIGPLALIAASAQVLIGVLGRLGMAAFGAARLLFTPWGLAIAALAVLVVLAIKFRDQFVAVLRGMYSAVLTVAKAIYDALQWLNPFAHHSPSLVERTRDGVKAMVDYWKGLRPVLTLLDTASAAVRRLNKAMADFTEAQARAQRQQDRKNIRKVGGDDAVKAYDNLIAANKALAAQLPVVEAEYNKQAKVVDKAKAALDAANVSLDAASARLDDLQKQQAAAQKVLDKLGNPEGLRSQATAAANMARSLFEAGNTGLAKRFQDQANALGAQADKAQAAQDKVNSLSDEIDKQSDAVDALTAKRDALQDTYDAESDKLALLKKGYEDLQQAIDDNTAALANMAQAAAEAIAKAKAAAEAHKASKAAKGSGATAGFNAAGGADVAKFGKNALPPNLPGGGLDETLKDFEKNLRGRLADQYAKLFGDPLAPLKRWWAKAKSGFDFIKSQFSKIDLGGGKDGLAGKLHLGDIEEKARKAFGTLRDEALRFWKIAGPTILDGLDAVVDALRVLGDIVRDVFIVVGHRALSVWKVLVAWFNENGSALVTVFAVIAKFVLDFYITLLRVATFIVRIIWPLIRTGLDGILQIIEGVLKVILGVVGFFVQLFTGHWKKAGKNLLLIFRGLGDIIVGALKTIVGLIGAGLLLLAGLIFTGLGSILTKIGKLLFDGIKALGPLLPKALQALVQAFAELGGVIADVITHYLPKWSGALLNMVGKLPGLAWDAFKAAWEAAWRFADFIAEKISGDWLTGGMASIQTMVESLAKGAWDFFTAHIKALWDFPTYIGGRIAEWTPKVIAKLGEWGGKFAQWLWDGLTAAFNGAWHLVGRVGDYLTGVRDSLAGKFGEWGGKFVNWLWDGLKNAWDFYWNLPGRIGSYLAGIKDDLLAKLQEWGGKFGNWLWDGVTEFISKNWDLGAKIVNATRTGLRALIKDIEDLGAWIIAGVAKGVIGAGADLGRAIFDTAKGALGWAADHLRINSPSKVAADMVGSPIGEGIGYGVLSQQKYVNASLATLVDTAQKHAQSALQATLRLPVLTQDVRLSYLNAPLTRLGAVNLGAGLAPSGAGVGFVGAIAAGSGTTINNEFNLSREESADPHAIAAVVGWSINGTVTTD